MLDLMNFLFSITYFWPLKYDAFTKYVIHTMNSNKRLLSWIVIFVFIDLTSRQRRSVWQTNDQVREKGKECDGITEKTGLPLCPTRRKSKIKLKRNE